VRNMRNPVAAAFLPFFLWGLGPSAAGRVPPPPSPTFPLALNPAPGDPGKAAPGWKPMKGSPAVLFSKMGSKTVFRMDCPFAKNPVERASWDHPFRKDLSWARGVGILLYAEDLSPVSHFTLFLRSGRGWYAFHLRIPKERKWVVLELPKEISRIEGVPSGFGKVEAVRFSVWRKGNRSTRVYFGGLGLLPGKGDCAVVRWEGTRQLSPGSRRYIGGFCLGALGLLRRLGMEASMVSDLDLRGGVPGRIGLLVLPRNVTLPGSALRPLGAFLERGGKILSFLVLPGALAERAGFRRERRSGGGRVSGVLSVEPGLLPGAPEKVPFQAAMTGGLVPAGKGARVAARWAARGKKPRPAVLLSEGFVHLDLLPELSPVKREPELECFYLSLLEKALPGAWRKAASNALEHMGAFGPWKDWARTRKALLGLAKKAGVALPSLEKVEKARKACARLLARGDARRVFLESVKVEEWVKRAFCRAQPSKKGEFRAFWCHSAFGVEGMTWKEVAGRLAANGFTAVFPNMLWGSAAYYESDVLPLGPGVEERGDQLALCLSACHGAGIQVHLWKVNWNTGNRSPEFIARMRKEGRLQVDSRGVEKSPPWLCPSNPLNRRLEADAMLEAARKYPVDGIHFDYIRYPGGDACYCGGCRSRFEKRIGRKVSPWPGAVLGPGPLRDAWLQFRRDNISALVSEVSARVKKLPRKVLVSAAVFRNWPVDRDRIGQDWALWCRKGWLDFVCPMDYTPDTGEFARSVASQIRWAGKVPVYPGIGYSVWKKQKGIYTLVEQVKTARRLGAPGFIVFNLGPDEAGEILPLLGLGLTKKGLSRR